MNLNTCDVKLGVRARRAAWCALLMCVLWTSSAWAEEIELWHAYRGAEEQALTSALKLYEAQHPGTTVKVVMVPPDAYANKLSNGIPRDNGPDVFIMAHERVGEWSASGLIKSWEGAQVDWGAYHPITVEALRSGKARWGIPLAYKSLVLYYNTRMIQQVPDTTDALLAQAKQHTDPSKGAYGLVVEASNFYMHVPWLTGFGGQIFDAQGAFALNSPEAARSYQFAHDLVMTHKVVPEDASGALVAQLFNDQRAAFAISGPWFMGELKAGLPYALAPLPTVSPTGLPAKPLLTVEAAFVSGRTQHLEAARSLALFLASTDASVVRATEGLQPVATLAAYDTPTVAAMQNLKIFRQQLDTSLPTPNRPEMGSVWEPAAVALRKSVRGAMAPDVALSEAQVRYKVYTKPAPDAKPVAPFLIAMGLVLMALLTYTAYRFRRDALWPKIKRSWPAYLYLAPALVGMMLLVIVPFVVGSAVSLFAHRQGSFTYVGVSNFVSILTSADYGITDPLSFYFTLGVTVLWTLCNIVLHVGLGMALAMILREPWLRMRGVYRVLLIVPWAIPNYITALIWKGMFHKQFGAINGVLAWFGMEPVSWFSQFSTAFAANLVTNAWLGFPFMMVVTLGALQSIPRELEEAAEVDGANAWQRFRHVVFPLLKPALVPAIILGTVWTFNMFNIIYLVSGGEPDGSTEILISEAYKWAFTRQNQYGYAAAYAVLIFLVLLVYSATTGQLKTQD